MKRAVVFRNGCDTDGKLIAIDQDIGDVVKTAGEKLGLPSASILFTSLGASVDSTALIRDDEALYVSCGEPFKAPEKGSANGAFMSPNKQTDWLVLNVGGKLFSTTRSTLVGKETDSMLARMF
ncbi:hypothetical protein CAPTEDRAFT_51362, partial [Capitella teleta]